MKRGPANKNVNLDTHCIGYTSNRYINKTIVVFHLVFPAEFSTTDGFFETCVKAIIKSIIANKIVSAHVAKDITSFWRSVLKNTNVKESPLNSIRPNNAHGGTNISHILVEKYKEFYNSAPSNDEFLSDIKKN